MYELNGGGIKIAREASKKNGDPLLTKCEDVFFSEKNYIKIWQIAYKHVIKPFSAITNCCIWR